VEAYFQEAGRAGRDEKKSYAVLIYNDADIDNSREQFKTSYPDLKTIRKTYQSLGNYYQLAVGSGKDLSFDFDLKSFSENFSLRPLVAYNALRILEKEGYLMLTEAISIPSRIHFLFGHDDLYRFQVENPAQDNFIKLLLRSYTGLFSDFVKISESELARRLSLNESDIITFLKRLHEQGVVSYVKSKNKPQVIFVRERQDASRLYITPGDYERRKTNAANRLQAVISYIKTRDQCRSQQLLEYFGEKCLQRCGKCDVCQERNKMHISDQEFEEVKNQIRDLIRGNPQSLQEIAFQLKSIPEERIIGVLRWLEDNDRIERNENQQYSWRKQFKLMF
jgi:ATP-dependent DNA helicase RecQ